MVFRTLLFCALLLSAGFQATAAERILGSISAGECTLSVEAAENWPALRLRASHPNHRPCRIDKAAMVQALSQAVSNPDPAWTSREFTTLAIGRLIDYPWLVRFLAASAARDPGWNAAAGKPVKAPVNRYVADILSSPEIVREIEPPLREHRYRITGVSVEKVLIGGSENVPGLEEPRPRGRIPFDAQVWFRLEPF